MLIEHNVDTCYFCSGGSDINRLLCSQPPKDYNVGDHVSHSDTDSLPVGTVLESNGVLYVRGTQRAGYPKAHLRYIVSLSDNPKQKMSFEGYIIKYLPEPKEKPYIPRVGDIVTHEQAQKLPVNTLLIYKTSLGPSFERTLKVDAKTSHWVVTDRKFSDWCGVLRPVTGGDHWNTYYRIMYLPSDTLKSSLGPIDDKR